MLRERHPTNTANLMMVEVATASPMGIAPGSYPLYIGGWKWATKDANIQDADVGLIVKCSGLNPKPRPGRGQKPNTCDYGRDRQGCQPTLIQFPIAHREYHEGCGQVVAVGLCEEGAHFNEGTRQGLPTQ